MTNNKAIELLDNLIGMVEDNHGSDYDKAIHMAIDALKAADVVEVVRCKDCKKREHCRTTNTWAVAPSDDWFCADGEREKS